MFINKAMEMKLKKIHEDSHKYGFGAVTCFKSKHFIFLRGKNKIKDGGRLGPFFWPKNLA